MTKIDIKSTAYAASINTSNDRFTQLAQILHWATALLMIFIVVIAWHMKMFSKTDLSREVWYYIHESIGITILAMTIVRLAWRCVNPPPPLQRQMSVLANGIATASHFALYGVLIVMPLSGYCIAAGTGHSLLFFSMVTVPPLLPENQALAAFGKTVHAVGQWILYLLFGLHVLATTWHIWIRRDGILDRMMPPQENARSSRPLGRAR